MNKSTRIIYTIIGLFLFLVSLNAKTRICYDLIFALEYFALYPLLVISFITSITLSIIDYKHKTKYKIIHLIILFSIGAGILSGELISRLQNKSTINNFKKIVSAVNKYKTINKSYPPDLNKLVPSYLEKIPSSYCGIEQLNYFYLPISNKDSITDFSLSVYDRPTQLNYRFSSEKNSYEYEDSMYH